MKKLKLLAGLSFLTAAALTPVRASSYDEFRDLPEYAWYEHVVAQALDLGIIDGVDGNTFAPDDPIRSIDTAKAFYRMAGEPYWIDAAYYNDVSAGYDSLAASYCTDLGIMSGYLDGSFRPDEWISRLDLLTMTYAWARADSRDFIYTEDPNEDLSTRALQWAQANGLYHEEESFMLTDPVTRAQACQLFVRAVSTPRTEDGSAQTDVDPAAQSEPVDDSGSQGLMDMLFGWMEPEVNDDPVNPGNGSEEDIANAALYGIDISEHQGDIDLSPYQGQFVIIRAGWHTTEDLYFRENVRKCEELGIPYGLYWYSYALDTEQAAAEAEAFARAIDGMNPAMGVWIDMETDSWKAEHGFEESQENISAITGVIGTRIQQLGLQPGIYCNARWLPYFDETLAAYPRWVAAYGPNDGDIHGNYSSQAVMFQYTSNPIDKNVLYSGQ